MMPCAFGSRSVCLLSVLVLAVWVLPGCASDPEPPPPPEATRVAAYDEGVPGGVMVETLQVSARVTAIDRAQRRVTLLGPDGDELQVKVGPAAANFDRIDVGDTVQVTLTEELVIAIGDAASAQDDGSAAVVALAPVGAKPGGVVVETTRITGTVTAIDEQARIATLRFEDGSIRSFPVRDDVDLSQRRVGETVVFQVTERIALEVRED